MNHFKIFKLLTIHFVLLTHGIFAASTMNPTIAIDTNGNAIAIWEAQDSITSLLSIQANTYTNGSWGTPSVITTGGTLISNPIIGIRAISSTETSAVVVWTDISNGSIGLFTAMLPTSSGSWTSAQELPLNPNETINTDYALRVNNNTGGVILIYTSNDMVTSDHPVKSATSTINSSNSWTTPVVISSD